MISSVCSRSKSCKLQEIATPKVETYDLSLHLSVCVCPLLWCFGCPLLVLHCLVPPLSPLSLSWLAHVCVSTADPGSPPAAAATAAGRLGRFRAPSAGAGTQDLSSRWPGPERPGPARPHQSWQQCDYLGQYLHRC